VGKEGEAEEGKQGEEEEEEEEGGGVNDADDNYADRQDDFVRCVQDWLGWVGAWGDEQRLS